MLTTEKIWQIDQLPLALDDGPIVEGGFGWPRVEVTGTGKYLPPPEGPLEVVWKRKLAKIDDFCWPAMHLTPAIRASAANELDQHLAGFSLVDVQYIKDFSWKSEPPIERVYDKKPTIKVLFVTHCVDADEARSTIVRGPVKDVPDQIGIYVDGIEKRESIQKPAITGKWRVRTTAKKPGQGVFVHRRDIEGFDFFRINQNRRSIYCTDSARGFVISRSFTGLDFLEAGEII